jgi:signal transduction histidine kinase/DNA-binding response OmpR family regulator/predicted RNA-binding protein with RPS1 domain
VEKLLAYGMFVRLGDGTRAYIRRRELTWAGNIDPRDRWREGEEITGVVLKLASSSHSLELSHRKTLLDPWEEFKAKFHQGDVVEGTVKSLMRYGIFVEVMPGVDGLIPLPELATWPVQKPEEVAWVGDIVEAVITQLDCRTKKLRLSSRARLRQQEIVAGILEDFNLFLQPDMMIDDPDGREDNLSNEVEIDLQTEVDIAQSRPKDVGPILVIDDCDEVRLPLVGWLQHRGYKVDQAKDAEEAEKKTSENAYDLLFVDLNLPGMDGLTLLRRLKQRGMDGRVAIMSSPEWLAGWSSEIEALDVLEAFAKPLDLAEIEYLLTRIGQGQTLPRWHMTPRLAPIKTPKSFQQLVTAVRTNISLTDQFQTGLKQLVATTRAETGIIFRLDPISRVVSVAAHIGNTKLNEDAIRVLGSSPVRDVIEEGQQVLEGQMSGQTLERFRKLLELLPFESCLGAPIEACGETHRAVFLFHRKPKAFNHYHLRDTLATTTLLALAIERQITEQRYRSHNKLLLAGQLMSGFSHEVYNKMSGLEIQLRNLQHDCRLFGHKPAESANFAEIRQAVEELVLSMDDLKNTVELFQRLMRTDEDQQVGINQVIQKMAALLRPILQKHSIKMKTELSSNLPGAMGEAIQLQQVFLNIMLNAIQHMALKPGRGKVLTITTSYQPEDPCPIKIRFTDMGPGIHRRVWEKIFNAGYTTRLGGTGQGLYIARSLIEALKGNIRVERSVVLLGTTFLVELPAT